MSVVRPTSFAEAAALLAELGPSARLIAGGTDTLTRLDAGAAPPAVWVDMSTIAQGRAMELVDGELRIGALVSFQAMAGSELLAGALPALHQAANIMGAMQIRSRGTIGGNLCNASPAGDSIPPLVVAGAQIGLISTDGERWMLLEDFFLGPGRNALEPGEVVTGVRCAVVPGTVSAFVRVGARAHHVITKASAAVSCQFEDGVLREVRYAMGAVAPKVIRAPAVEAILEGQRPAPALIERAAAAAGDSARPIDDVRSTVAYRREACRQLVGMLLGKVGAL
jgi:CO/xanthine dehydrogenase FAD-binding subunit